MPSRDAAIELQNLCLEGSQLDPESGDARAGHFGDPGVVEIGNDFEQLFDTPTPDRCNDPELSKVSAN